MELAVMTNHDGRDSRINAPLRGLEMPIITYHLNQATNVRVLMEAVHSHDEPVNLVQTPLSFVNDIEGSQVNYSLISNYIL